MRWFTDHEHIFLLCINNLDAGVDARRFIVTRNVVKEIFNLNLPHPARQSSTTVIPSLRWFSLKCLRKQKTFSQNGSLTVFNGGNRRDAGRRVGVEFLIKCDYLFLAFTLLATTLRVTSKKADWHQQIVNWFLIQLHFKWIASGWDGRDGVGRDWRF